MYLTADLQELDFVVYRGNPRQLRSDGSTGVWTVDSENSESLCSRIMVMNMNDFSYSILDSRNEDSGLDVSTSISHSSPSVMKDLVVYQSFDRTSNITSVYAHNLKTTVSVSKNGYCL
jgi:hypothetical protein